MKKETSNEGEGECRKNGTALLRAALRSGSASQELPLRIAFAHHHNTNPLEQ